MTATLTPPTVLPPEDNPPPARHRGPIVLLTVVLILAFGAAAVGLMNSPRASSYRMGSPAEIVHGVSLGDSVAFGAQLDWSAADPDSYSEAFARSPMTYGKFVDFPFTAGIRASVDTAAEQVAAHNGILFLTLEPKDGLASVTPESLSRLTEDLTRWNSQGTPIMVRFAHEMNGSWYAWGQQPTAFITAFRAVAAAVHEAPDSSMVWSPNDGAGYPFPGGKYETKPGTTDFALLDTNHDGRLSESDDMYAPYWPGNDAVDWVGLSLYHFGEAYPWGANVVPEPTKFADKLTGDYRNAKLDQRAVPNFYTEYADGHNKPMVISETAAAYNPVGSPNTARTERDIKQAWWQQVFSDDTHQRFPRIHMINWFEQQKVETDFTSTPIPWGVEYKRDLRIAFREWLPSWVVFAR